MCNSPVLRRGTPKPGPARLSSKRLALFDSEGIE